MTHAITKWLTETLVPKRGESARSIASYIFDETQRNPERYQPIDENQNKWMCMAFTTNLAQRDFVIVTVRNGEIYRFHYIEDYFEGQDRTQILTKLGVLNDSYPSVKPYQVEFAENLCRLFRLRDFLEGGKAVGPITKSSIKAGDSPYVLYATAGNDNPYRAMDEYRKPELDEVINALCRQSRKNRHPHLKEIFQHIANGGDGNAPQKQAGGNTPSKDCDIKRAVEGWPKAKKAGENRTHYLGRIGIDPSTLTDWRRLYRERNLQNLTDCLDQ